MSIASGRNDITFKSQGLTLAAHLYTPEGFGEGGSYPAVVISSAFNQVKEQTGAVYGKRLAELGYVAISFDHIGYGNSEGEIRNNENAFVKIESIRDAISFMGTLPFVDRGNLFGLGVCASGGYMALVATTDKRLKAVASVSGMLGNKASYFEAMDRETVTGLIAMQNAGRQKAYETGVVDYVDALGMGAEEEAIKAGATPSEGYDYYMTERAGAQTYPNYSHLSPSFMLEAPMLADATSYASYIYTPFMGIVGSKAMDPASGMLCTGPLTETFVDRASEPKEFVEIEGASHVDLYDKPEFVTQAVEAMDGFFKKHGGSEALAA
ncbi:alpha/beta hydrolase [Roseibium sp. SCPC15]|uniref:alpha/beta hydrolase n=1 Tax=Roseibium sp. SCP15 TaxID=3141376 RepID=UPI00333DADE2